MKMSAHAAHAAFPIVLNLTSLLAFSEVVARLRRSSAAARLLGLRDRILLRGCLSVCRECCVFQVRISATCRSLVQGSPTECCVFVCDLHTSLKRRPRPGQGCCSTGGKNSVW